MIERDRGFVFCVGKVRSSFFFINHQEILQPITTAKKAIGLKIAKPYSKKPLAVCQNLATLTWRIGSSTR